MLKPQNGNLEEIKEEVDTKSMASSFKPSPALSTSKYDGSEGDGLINWAINLPDDLSGSFSSNFFK